MAGVKDKVIVITGGCGDIGAATGQRLAEGGAKSSCWTSSIKLPATSGAIAGGVRLLASGPGRSAGD